MQCTYNVLKADGDCQFVEDLVFSKPDSDSEHISKPLLQARALSSMDWRKTQQQDPTLKVIIENLEVGSRVPVQ